MPQTSEVPILDSKPEESEKRVEAPGLHLVRDVRKGSLAELIGLETLPPKGSITYSAELGPNGTVNAELKVDVAGHEDKTCKVKVKPALQPSGQTDNQVIKRYYPPECNAQAKEKAEEQNALSPDDVRQRIEELTEDMFAKH